VETPEVWSKALSRTPRRYIDANHPAGCRTLFTMPRGATMKSLGYYSETKALVVDKSFAAYISGRDTVPSLEAVVYNGSDTPADMFNYEDVVSKGTHMLESVDQDMDEDELSGLYYTGGTTGRAKGVMLSHKNVMANAVNILMATGYNQKDVFLHAAPMFHLADVGSTFATTMVGACHAFVPAFNPTQVMQLIQDERVTLTVLVPTMINMILNHPDVNNYDLSSLRRLGYGASPMPVEVLKTGLKKWGQIFAQGYGLTEAAPLLTGLDTWEHVVDGPPEQTRRLSSFGKAVLGVEVRVVNAEGDDIQPGELGDELRWQQVPAGGQHLAELHEHHAAAVQGFGQRPGQRRRERPAGLRVHSNIQHVCVQQR